ncbi:flagellin N-terminal helical domain-containing protein [Burkholderia sp. PAMC 26561]|uniref:flagellin N-terminal helical domain-containing protein n=1 Tax=Burkholderia sp. PAMC 26561 TaxID=1795043 RepID=UPI00076AEC41|nr:flagellin [Burkholderia sp. PAMC 26561]AME22811.1 flagellin [Burkholderia sp. PAMC 26561]
MIGINSNINSLVAQQNLNGTQSALSSAITRLSSGKRINSAADDAAGQAIASRMTTQINGLNQGVSNANDGVSMTQTASSGLNQITDNLQRIRQLAVQASSGSLSTSDQAALQKEVTQRIAEVNRIASQTQYNGTNVLDGSAGNVSFQVGANVGQTISIDLSNGVSAAKLGGGVPQSGSTIGSITGVSLKADGTAATSNAAITTVNVLADGKGGFTFTDQNNQALSSAASTALFGTSTKGSGLPLTLTAAASSAFTPPVQATAQSAAATSLATISTTNGATAGTGSNPYAANNVNLGQVTGVALNADGTAATGATAAITSINVLADGNGGFKFTDQGGNALSGAAAALFTSTAGTGTPPAGSTLAFTAGGALGATAPTGFGNANELAAKAGMSTVNADNNPPQVSGIDLTQPNGANLAIESIDAALNTVNGIQANLGAAQNRFTSISATQTAQSTNLSTAQSQITDANFAQETANLSKAQVLQQAGISVLAQANSLPQQVLKLLG